MSERTEQNFSEQNGLNRTEQDQIGSKMTEWTEWNQCEPNKTFGYLSFSLHF